MFYMPTFSIVYQVSKDQHCPWFIPSHFIAVLLKNASNGEWLSTNNRCSFPRSYVPNRYVILPVEEGPVLLKGLGHAILGNFSTDQMVI